MSDLNRWSGIGRLGQDPEVRQLTSGESVASFSIATTDKWKDKKTGEQQERTEWHRISVFGGLAKVCGDYLKKGSQVLIEGQLRTRKWTDKQGVERYTTEINCHNMQMLGGGKQAGEGGVKSNRPTGPAPGPDAGSKEEFDSEIPF